MIKMAIGWIFTSISSIVFAFVLIEVTAEVKEVKTLSELIDEQVDLQDIQLSSNSYMYDQHGDLISELYIDHNRRYLHYDEIPVQLIDAFIATEDQRFFEHKGYDAIAMVRALLANVRQEGIEEGASTMTQQLARNLFLTHEQTYNRKMTEILYSHELEKHFTKEEIIELYVNSIYFSNGVYGIEAASYFYFNKPSKQLTLAETAFLSAIPNNPSHYDPLQHFDRTLLRQEWILQKMLEVHYISTEEYEQARNEHLTINQRQRIDEFPDYVTYIHHELTELIAQSEGYSLRIEQAESDDTRQEIERDLQNHVQQLLESGIHIETALEPYRQNSITKAIQRYLPEDDIQAAVAMIDHHNHEIVAISGGKGYNKFDFHRGYQDFRQPGSAIKPILVYGPFIEETGASISTQIDASNICINDYCPNNYGDQEYGHVPILTAFKHSYNTPAVRLLHQIGIQHAFTYLEPFSFSRVVSDDYVPGAALGGLTYGVSPLELTQAYTTFATDGAFTQSYGIRAVKDQEGTILYSWEQESEQVWSSSTNQKMRSLLDEVITSGTGRQANITASYRGGKTGTTDEYRNLWFVGLTDQYTAGVWIGNDDNQSIERVNNRSPHLDIWRESIK
ncbi:transglycosylase domain-containing protein [Halalkalibacter sp. APA_J-10(15)]|uniref:transglycosylase domain-containing protein n=1 Tax=Halalkalibacter sp. APA_J-10(15) TaxID=2933805 RepID=UPI001FF40C9A|nr:transglycosylase domain-containing protein [Halalkalibacter sp. APA_J-10(15)]MCK0470425.1 penicillin-binding protein [Halalkalibacter sp. APA_J-10(15)]